MRGFTLSTLLAVLCGAALAQSTAPDAALLTRTRALYDAPFTRNLISFDCAVQFDWKQHVTEAIGSVPDGIAPTLDLLSAIHHRIFMDRSGAVLSDQPNPPDLDGIPMGPQIEHAFDLVIPAGLNAWLPYAYGEILPEHRTQFSFQKTNAGYVVDLKGQDLSATLQLSPNLRITRGFTTKPQAMNFTTNFEKGPQGYLLRSVVVDSPERDAAHTPPHTPTFTYAYQDVQGFQLPADISVTTGTGEVWKYSLTDCRVVTGTTVTVPVKPPSP
jgi:hypothetical protein